MPVRRVPDGVAGIAYGLGDGRIDLRPLAAGTNPFNAGDVFVTSGTGGIYKPGIPVAIGIKRHIYTLEVLLQSCHAIRSLRL